MQQSKSFLSLSFMLIIICMQLLIWNVNSSEQSNNVSLFKARSDPFTAQQDRQKLQQFTDKYSDYFKGNCFQQNEALSRAKHSIWQIGSKIKTCQQKEKQLNFTAIAQYAKLYHETQQCKKKDVCPICPEKTCSLENCPSTVCDCPICEAQRQPCGECQQVKQCQICEQPIENICKPAPICPQCKQTQCQEVECPPEKICQQWDEPEPCKCPHCEEVQPCPPQQIKQCPKHTCLEQQTCPSFECHVDCQPLNDQIQALQSKITQAEPKIAAASKQFNDCQAKNKQNAEECQKIYTEQKLRINQQLQYLLNNIEENLPNANKPFDFTKTKQLLTNTKEVLKTSAQPSSTLSIYKQLATEFLLHLKSLKTQIQKRNKISVEYTQMSDTALKNIKECQRRLLR